MAASKNYFTLTKHRYLPNENSSPINTDPLFELDESDIWNSGRSVSPEFRKPASRKKSAAAKKRLDVGGVVASLPVKVPDWSKILKEEYMNNSNNRRGESEDELGAEEEENRVAPHEYLARRRIASFSVQEGIGRTLKGRDLSRVRNAIWEKTGFQD